jgi:Uri superfamily endonuclease
MPPHPKKRYHVQQFKNRPPGVAEEVFNRHHSRLRNVVEQSFGAVKSMAPFGCADKPAEKHCWLIYRERENIVSAEKTS